MAYSELDSFVNKFKALCQAGRNAKLTLSSNAGKACVNLRLDLAVPPQQDPQPLHQNKYPRNGPGQQRHRERQAAAGQAAAEQAEASISREEREVLDMAARVAEEAIETAKVDTEKVKQVTEQVDKDAEEVELDDPNLIKVKPFAKEVTDEICPDSEYESEPTKDNKEPNAEPPPPRRARERTLGGIDYYLLRYDDPIYDDDDVDY